VLIVGIPQTITFPQPSNAFVGQTVQLGAYSSSGRAIQYVRISGPCSVSGGNAHAAGGGVCVVEARQGGDGTYAAATPVRRSFEIFLFIIG
jgi:hypothetical protein